MRKLLLVTAALLAPWPALAQSALEVVVLDRAEGSPVADAAVTLTDPATGATRSGRTDSGGKAKFPALAPGGSYVASALGVSSEAVAARSNFAGTVTLLVDREVGSAPPTLVVEARRSVTGLNFSNAEVSASLDAADLKELPVEARDLSTVLFRLPNVTQSTGFFPEAPAISINGANGLFTQYLVDGLDNNENFLGGQKFAIPVGAVRDVTVLAGSYSVEFGRTANGIVNVTTKGGTNDWAGEAFLLWRPGSLTDGSSSLPARDLSGNAVLDGFRRYQGGASLGGPLVRDRTFFFVNAEFTRDRKDNRLTVPLLGVNETVRGENAFDYLTLRLDQAWGERWSGTLRVNRGEVEIERPGGGLEGGFTFPSAGDTQTRTSTLAALSLRYAGERLSTVSELQFSAFDWNYGQPRTNGPQATILSPLDQTIGVVGNNGFFFDEEERTWQAKQKATLDLGRLRLSAGAEVLNADFGLKGGGNPAGNYTVRLNDAQFAAVRALNRGGALDIGDLPRDVQVVDYAVETRPASFGKTQTLFGGWAEAELDLTADLTARLGLRYDYDTLTAFGGGGGDTDNLAPRASLNWRLSERSVVRAGAGLFYEKLPYVVISDALQRNADTPAFRAQLQDLVRQGRLPADTNLDRVLFDGNQTVNLAGVGFLAGPSGDSLFGRRQTLSSNERQILNPNGYDNPYSFQGSLGYQREIEGGWLFDASLLYSRGYDLVRLIDVNAPARYAGITAEQAATLSPAQLQGLVRTVAAADATRPTRPGAGGATSILVSDTGGNSEYKAATLSVTKRPAGDRYGLRFAYTLSRLENDTDDINFRANNANDFDAEWGPSLNDRTHVLSTILFLYPLDGLTLSLAGLFQSGQPVNYGPDAAVYGTTDLNGDGRSFTNQYTGNPDRAPGQGRNSGRLPWSKTVDLGAQFDVAAGPGRLELRADVFNLLDTRNLGGYTVNATASNQFQVFGRPFTTRSADRPRTFQFGLRYLF